MTNFEKSISEPDRKNRDDAFFATRHSISEYKLNESLIGSNTPETAPSVDKQWFNSDLTQEGIELARERAKEFFDGLNPKTDALFFVSSDLVRAAETAKIYLDEARSRGFEVIKPRDKAEPGNYRDKAEEIGEGYVRKVGSLTLDHLDNMLREQIFQGKDYLKDMIKEGAEVSAETREKWAAARKIIEADNKGSWGANYAAHSEEIEKIFSNVKSARTVYETKFHDIIRLIRFGQEKINQQQPTKNIKVLGFSHENSFLYFLKENFGETLKNCESIEFKVGLDNAEKVSATAKGKTVEVNI